ncbi:MAG: GAF domain-containing protein [Candidatus Levybacteria bacterium]|nr:GAF domain-containing protein [Candidatus Levybacteria bacterium]
MLVFAILSTLFFGLLAVLYSYREARAHKLLLEKDHIHNQQLYQISLLTQIQDRIGYELHKEKVIDVILDNLNKFFTYTTASAILVKEGALRFKSQIATPVSRSYLIDERRNMVSNLTALTKRNLPLSTDEEIHGSPLDDTQNDRVLSSFQVPFVVNNATVGLISLSSTTPNHFTKEDEALLEKLVYQASHALTKLQEVLATEEGRLKALIRSLTDGIFMVDTQSQILLINDAAKNILVIGKDRIEMLDVLRALPKDYDLMEKIHESISQKKTVEDRGIKIGNKTVQVFITPVIETRTLTVLGLSILLHDSTLEENISQMKRDFVNMMVHELRAPIVAMKDAAKLVLGMIETMPNKNPQIVSLIEIIHSQAGDLVEQVSSLLDAAKMEEHRFILEKKLTDIESIIQNRIELFSPQSAKKGITLSVNLDRNLPLVLVDPIRMEQTINNLLSNSLKFTGEGGKIAVKAELIRDAIKISISDTGIGIPKEKLSSLFQKFSQIGSSSSVSLQGRLSTGLGLYIVKGIVEAHGGTISVDSEVDKGTTISFTLPLNTKQQPEQLLRSQVFKTAVN